MQNIFTKSVVISKLSYLKYVPHNEYAMSKDTDCGFKTYIDK